MTIQAIIRQAVEELIEASTNEEAVKKSLQLHQEKIHFVPPQYRVIGGILQSLNIKFGNFIEKLIDLIIKSDPVVEAHPVSGKKIPLSFSAKTDAMIDAYITERQLPSSPDDCEAQYRKLQKEIFEVERRSKEPKQTIKKDIDALFESGDGGYVYAELKYNDDHDTGKFVDINRKFIKTYAGLLNVLKVEKIEELRPLIYYFNPIKRWGPIYVPSQDIMRGKKMFDEYFATKFDEVDGYLREIGEDPVIMQLFDDVYHRVRFGN